MKKMIQISNLVASIVLLLVFVTSAHAAQSNLQITPPPIASPEFEAGKVDAKAGLTYINMSGSGISLNGYGANIVRRRAFTDALAWDMQGGLFILKGSLGSNDMSFWTIPLSLNVEYQPLKTPSSSLILFAGPNFSYGNMKIKDGVLYAPFPLLAAPSKWDLNMSITMYGWQGGGQYSAQLGDFKVSPFAMIQSQQGTVAISYGALSQGSTSIPAFTTTSYGLDLLYLPWNVTLSSVLQQAAKSGDNSGVNTTIFTLSHTF